jgi:hypothetical protein
MGTRAAVGRALALAGIAMGWAGHNASICEAAPWQVVAREDGPAPGIPGEPGAEFFILDGPAINNGGKLAFNAVLDVFSLQQPSRTETVWSGSAGSLQLVAREGDVAPGTSVAFQSFHDDPHINGAGQLLVHGRLEGPVDQGDGLWVGTPGNLQLLARTGVALPGLTTAIDDIDPFSLAFGDGGHAAFLGSDANADGALWAGKPGELKLVAKAGMAIPAGTGLPAGTVFSGAFLSPTDTPTINASGQVGFQISLESPTTFRRSIWVGAPGALQLLVYEDKPVPGMPGVEFFLIESAPIINNAGQTAFKSTLSNFQETIWRGTPGNLQRVAYSGQVAPVGVAGVTFDDVGAFDELRFNDAGDVGFRATVDGAGVTFDNDLALFAVRDGGTKLVARAGNAAPGMGAGVTFDTFTHYSMNGEGQMAFLATTTGGSLQYSEGLWAETAAGQLELVVREGDWVRPNTGEVVRLADASSNAVMQSMGYGQISIIDFRSAFVLSNEAGAAWNDAGQITFSVSLMNSSATEAVFVTTIGGKPGDFDGDGDVDGNDFLAWQRGPHSASDLAAWKSHYGTTFTPTGAVPEPGCAALAMTGIVAVLVGWRRARGY